MRAAQAQAWALAARDRRAPAADLGQQQALFSCPLPATAAAQNKSALR